MPTWNWNCGPVQLFELAKTDMMNPGSRGGVALVPMPALVQFPEPSLNVVWLNASYACVDPVCSIR